MSAVINLDDHRDSPVRLSLRKAKPRKDVEILIDGAEPLIDAMREREAVIAELQADQERDRERLRGIATAQREKSEAVSGQRIDKVRFSTSDGTPAWVKFWKRYAAIDAEYEGELYEILGDAFDELLTVEVKLKVRDGFDAGDLEFALGPHAWSVLKKFCQVDESIKVKKGFDKKQHALREVLGPDQVSVIDQIIGDTQATPRVSLK